MKKTILSITLAISSLAVFSQNYSDGLYLVNEGNFGSFDGDISFFDNETQTLYENIFQTENPGEEGFDVLQDFEIFGGKAYFLSKGASDNQIAISNADDFSLTSTIDLATAGPQSITMISEDKAYVSCANAPNLRILDIDSESMIGSVGSSIGSFSSQDNIAIYGSTAFIFMGDKLGIIDTELDSAYSDIELPNAEVSCSGMVVSNDKLFVLSNSGWSGSSSRLFRIDLLTNEVELNLDLSTLGKAMLLQSDDSNVYFMIGNEVYQLAMDSDIIPSSSFATSSYEASWDLAYGKAFFVDINNSRIFIGSAEGFVEDGSYEVLDLNDGSSLSTGNLSGGIGLNQFHGGTTLLGLNNINDVEFSVYPIPAINNLTIELMQSEKVEYKIVNMDGRIVSEGQLLSSINNTYVGDLPKGMYILSIYSSNTQKSKRIVIQ